MSVINSLDAALKVFALSKTTSNGVERCDVNLLKLLRKLVTPCWEQLQGVPL